MLERRGRLGVARTAVAVVFVITIGIAYLLLSPNKEERVRVSNDDAKASEVGPRLGASGMGTPRSTPEGRSIQVRGTLRMGERAVPHAYLDVVAGNARASVLTDEDGSFAVEIAASSSTLRFVVPGFEVLSGPALDASLDHEGVTVEVRGGASLSGRVLLRGAPVPNASVTIVPGWVVHSDDAGGFRFDPLAGGTYTLRAEHPGLEAEGQTAIGLAAGELRSVDVELDHSGSISGTVVDERGQPVPGVGVSWRCTECIRGFANVVTRPDGSFRVTRLSAGTYMPRLTLGGAPLSPADQTAFPTIVLRDGAMRAPLVTLAVSAATDSIVGKVVGPDGVPEAGIAVVVPPLPGPSHFDSPRGMLRRTVTRPDGSFAFAGLPRGTYRIAAGELGELGEVEAHPGGPEVVLRLAAVTTVRGTLEGFSTNPVRVGIIQDIEGRRTFRPDTVAGTAFMIPGIAPGDAWMIATDGKTLAVERVLIPGTTEVEFTLHPRPVAKVQGTLGAASSLAGVTCLWLLNLPRLGHVGIGDAGRVTVTPEGLFTFNAPTGVPLALSCAGIGPEGVSVKGVLEISALGLGGVSALRLDLAASAAARSPAE